MLKTLLAGALALAFLCLPAAAMAACPTALTYGALTGKDATPATQSLQTVTSGGALLSTPVVHGNDGTATPKALALDANCNLFILPGPGAVIGGISFNKFATPTIQNASYVLGNCMGGFQTVTVSGTSGATGTLHSLTLVSKGGLITAKQIYVFEENPSGSTCTDKSTFTIASADRAKLLTTFSITPTVPTGDTGSYGDNTSLGRAFVTNGNGNLYVAIVETATETPATTTDLVISLGGYLDKP